MHRLGRCYAELVDHMHVGYSAHGADDPGRHEILHHRAGLVRPLVRVDGQVESVLLAGCRGGGDPLLGRVGLAPERVKGVGRGPVGGRNRNRIDLCIEGLEERRYLRRSAL